MVRKGSDGSAVAGKVCLKMQFRDTRKVLASVSEILVAPAWYLTV